MPYITTEASEQEGSPVEVYEFFMANKRYLISSGGVRDQVTFNGFRCESLPISRGQVVYTSDNQKSALDVVIVKPRAQYTALPVHHAIPLRVV